MLQTLERTNIFDARVLTAAHADALRTLALLQAELPLKKAAALAAEIHGVKKNALYKYALEQQGE